MDLIVAKSVVSDALGRGKALAVLARRAGFVGVILATLGACGDVSDLGEGGARRGTTGNPQTVDDGGVAEGAPDEGDDEGEHDDVDAGGGSVEVDAGGAADAGSPDAGPAPLTEKEIAQKLVASNKLRDLPGATGYLFQIRDIANGTTKKDCGVDIRILQYLLKLTERYSSVGVSSLNRRCTGELPNPNSSHWVDGGGKAVDIWALNGKAINGSDAQTIDMLTYAHGFMPKGTRVGQVQCRTAAQNALIPNFTKFDDYCNHSHLDVASTSGTVKMD